MACASLFASLLLSLPLLLLLLLSLISFRSSRECVTGKAAAKSFRQATTATMNGCLSRSLQPCIVSIREGKREERTGVPGGGRERLRGRRRESEGRERVRRKGRRVTRRRLHWISSLARVSPSLPSSTSFSSRSLFPVPPSPFLLPCGRRHFICSVSSTDGR